MSHTNVDSKTYHVVNSTITYIDDKEQKIEAPVGGINIKGKDVKSNSIEIALNTEYRLKSDDGKTVLYKGTSLEEVKAKEAELQQRDSKSSGKKNATKVSARDEYVTK